MRDAILIAFSIRPLAKPGCALTPRIVIVAVGREGLVLELAGAFAVDGVGEVRAELFHVDVIDAVADFLVGREQDLHVPCRIGGIAGQDRHRIHDLGDAGLVVGAEQGRAVGGDDVVADLVLQRRILGDADDLARSPGSTMSPPW